MTLLSFLFCFKAIAEAPPVPIATKEHSCGVLEMYTGEVEILNATRSKLIPLDHRAPIPCGAWVSVKRGWIQIRHQSGPRFQASEDSFFQLPEYRKEWATGERDQVVIYRGQLFVGVKDAEEDFRLRSAMARARVRRGGKALFLIDSEASDAQLISLRNVATLENAFEPQRRVRVNAGESTRLNLKMKRLIAAYPQPIDLASLRPKLYELRLSDKDQLEAIESVQKRLDRKWMPEVKGDEDSVELVPAEKRLSKQKLARGIASLPQDSPDYSTARTDSLSKHLHSHFLARIRGGESQYLKPAVLQAPKSKLMESIDHIERQERGPASIKSQHEGEERERILRRFDDVLPTSFNE
jgi:hypothetical protein